jgi:uroporphyrinogen decarboxylase
MYRELLMPRHRELFQRLGRYFIYHTDGNLRTSLPLLIEAGIQGINPIEIKAGNDFARIAEAYGDRIVLTGGIDVMVLATNDLAKIEREAQAKLSAARGKKYIYHSDHSIPPTMTLDAYRFLMDLVHRWTFGGD